MDNMVAYTKVTPDRISNACILHTYTIKNFRGVIAKKYRNKEMLEQLMSMAEDLRLV